jgi:hypothetical protein
VKHLVVRLIGGLRTVGSLSPRWASAIDGRPDPAGGRPVPAEHQRSCRASAARAGGLLLGGAL